MALSETDIAYIAGLTDGEGCITINKVYIASYGNYYKNIVSITNTDIDVLKWVCEHFGGRVDSHSEFYRNKPCYRWSLNGSKSSKFLESMLPYLRIKSKQAELSLEFIKTIGKGAKKLTNDIINQRKILKEKMYKLNHGE